MNDIVPAPKKNTQFVKGQSGNPAGRAKGSKNAISLLKIQVEGELRARMTQDMDAVIEKIIAMALNGDRDMLKLLYRSWVTGTKVGEDETPRDKIQIVIGKLDQIPAINGRVYEQSSQN